MRHIESHLQEIPLDGKTKCPHPKCRSVHSERDALKRHFEAVHHITGPHANGIVKKRKSEDEAVVARVKDVDEEYAIVAKEDSTAEPDLFAIDPQLLAGDEDKENMLVCKEDLVAEPHQSVIDPQPLAIDPKFLVVDPMMEFFCFDEAAACQDDSKPISVVAETRVTKRRRKA